MPARSARSARAPDRRGWPRARAAPPRHCRDGSGSTSAECARPDRRSSRLPARGRCRRECGRATGYRRAATHPCRSPRSRSSRSYRRRVLWPRANRPSPLRCAMLQHSSVRCERRPGHLKGRGDRFTRQAGQGRYAKALSHFSRQCDIMRRKLLDQGTIAMSLAAAVDAQSPSARALYDTLEDRILARDQVGASQTYYDLVRSGRPLTEMLREAVRIHGPYTHVPYHQRIDNGFVNFVNNDHCLLSARATLHLSKWLPAEAAGLPMAQTIWYIPTGLDILDQKIHKAPGHYARGMGPPH